MGLGRKRANIKWQETENIHYIQYNLHTQKCEMGVQKRLFGYFA